MEYGYHYTVLATLLPTLLSLESQEAAERVDVILMGFVQVSEPHLDFMLRSQAG